jgi:hypothetical protein
MQAIDAYENGPQDIDVFSIKIIPDLSVAIDNSATLDSVSLIIVN